MKGRTILIALLLALFAACAGAETLTVENDRLSLSFDPDTLEIAVTVKETGQTIASVNDAAEASANASWKGFLQSSLAIEVTKGATLNAERVDVFSAKPLITVEPFEDGFDARMDFRQYGQRLTLRVTLREDGVSCVVPGDSIEEYRVKLDAPDKNGNEYQEQYNLCGLYICPFFGATRGAEREGYMFVPEAAGAIIALADGTSALNTPYAKRVYGANIGVEKYAAPAEGSRMLRPAREVTLPVYGMAYTSDHLAYLAVVTHGADACDILCYPAGVTTEYNWTAARFILREEYIMQTTRSLGLRAREKNAYIRDMGVRFFLLTGDDATYAGMARRYREHLAQTGALTSAENAGDYRVRLDFLGAEAARWLLWDRVVPMTRVSQMADILEAYARAGIRAPLALYKGWQSGGLSKNYGGGDLSLEGALGSVAELRRLSDALAREGGTLLLEQEAVLANTDRLYNMQSDIVRTISQVVAEAPTGKTMYRSMYYLTPARTGELLADFAKRYAADFDGVSLPTLGHSLYSYYSGGRYFTRGDVRQAYLGALSALSDMTRALSNPIDAYFSQTDIYLDMPLSVTSHSFIEAEVPFLPLVLSGSMPYYSTYVNFEPNQRVTLLKLAEYGANPSFILTGEDVSLLVDTNSEDIYSARHDVLLDTVLACDAALAPVRKALDGAAMRDHAIPAPGVAVVTYDNGARVLVNYNATDALAEGTLVPAMSFTVLEGGDGHD